MNKILTTPVVTVIVGFSLTMIPVSYADPGTDIVGNAGGGELPLPMTPGDGIGPGGALPPGFLQAPGPYTDTLGPAAYSPLEDPR